MHKRVHVEFIFRTENGLRMKMRSFKKSCLKDCYKILKFANFENGGTDIQGVILRAMREILPTSSLLLVNNRSAYFEMEKELSYQFRFWRQSTNCEWPVRTFG